MKTDSVVRARTPTMMITTGGHVTSGVQELVSTFVIRRTDAAPNELPGLQLGGVAARRGRNVGGRL
jgi:hypothetical protein